MIADARALARAVALCCLTLLPAGCGSFGPEPGSASARPNVLLITLDTTRADHLNPYGYRPPTSPILSALAGDAVLFQRSISTSALTPMSHASIMTGLNPYAHGVRVFSGKSTSYLSEDHPTLAEILLEHGWETAAFVSSFTASSKYGLDAGFGVFDDEIDEEGVDPEAKASKKRPLRKRKGQRRGDETTKGALSFLERTKQPFLLWVHYFDPHDSFLTPPKKFIERFPLDTSQEDKRLGMYDAEIAYMDQEIGRLLDHLKSAGMYENTIVAIVADHGQGLNDHGWFQHRLLYQEQIRVPMILRLPGGPAGKTVTSLVRTTDLMPTILGAAGVEAPRSLDGRSLLDLIDGRPDPPRVAYAEALNTIDDARPRVLPPNQRDLLFVVMDERWKLIHHKNEPENDELYDLLNDPGEIENAAASYPEHRERLLATLEALGGTRIQEAPPDAGLSEEDRRRLESLGYIGDGN